MTLATITLCGWLAAAVAGSAAGIARRSLGLRMEAVARACHELRGPLTAARLGLELGARGGELSAAQLRALDLELGRAALALDDLAAARTRGRPRREAEAVGVRELLADSVQAWRPAADAAGATLELRWSGAPADVVGDRLRLAQATGNLIFNAIEHGGGAIAVRGGTVGAIVRIEVRDGGPGLPASVTALIHRRRAAANGRGHGLAIAESIARAHGGRLAAAPCEGGARIVLELPLATGSASSRVAFGEPV